MATPTTLPSTFAASSVLTSTQMNDLRGAFRVLQVESAAKIDTFSSTGSTFVDVTGLSVTITPSSTSNKVLVIAQLNGAVDLTADASATYKLVGGNSADYVPAAAGVRALGQYTLRQRGSVYEAGYWSMTAGSIVYLDSPATTSATTYKIQMTVNQSAGTATGFINRTGEDANATAISRLASSITAFEVSA